MQNKTITFNSSCGRFTFTAFTSFVEKHPEAIGHDVYDLMVRFDLKKYLHNDAGPAIIDNQSGNVDFWMNGKKVDNVTAGKIEHQQIFNKEIDKILND